MGELVFVIVTGALVPILVHVTSKATVCFFFVSRYMDEKNQ